MKVLGKKFTTRVLNNEVAYNSAKHKMQNIKFAITECVRDYDLESLKKVCEEGLKPFDNGLGGFPPSCFPKENNIRRRMVKEGISYEESKAIEEGYEREADEALFGEEPDDSVNGTVTISSEGNVGSNPTPTDKLTITDPEPEPKKESSNVTSMLDGRELFWLESKNKWYYADTGEQAPEPTPAPEKEPTKKPKKRRAKRTAKKTSK